MATVANITTVHETQYGTDAAPPNYHDGGFGWVHAHKKETAAVMAVLFASLTIVGVIYCVEPDSLHDAKRWADQDWVDTDCTIEDVGISYRGNCHMDVTLMMTRFNKFKECMGPAESRSKADLDAMRDKWEKTPPGLCTAKGDVLYEADIGVAVPTAVPLAAPTVPPVPVSLAATPPPAQAPAASASARRLGDFEQVPEPSKNDFLQRFFKPRQHIVDCHNGYLPWAAVRLTNQTTLTSIQRCAYEFGASAPSTNGNWDRITAQVDSLRRSLEQGQKIPCWVLASDNCVVAFRNQKVLEGKEIGKSNLLRTSGIICGSLALFSASLALFWHCQDSSKFSLPFGGASTLPPGGYHQKLPTREPAPNEVQLSDRVQQIVSIAATRFSDPTPSASGDSTLRVSGTGSHRTIEVVGPGGSRSAIPRNVAADFLENKRRGGW
eukprot:gnl/TRDRNA2_/TRDRNA2_181592_c0_seq1.p1 gnl/TRDRNA2_/TRDRNA2_181592_c0~~gnl/TRDRNA2_/TRDRNA2_181592_c0_seq1.p1  ORF type:complete len:437 (+),score=69.93 gnl/TRDRNA2_/TRDRNA2_181592_c0_seq1:91-1401(+)